MSFREATTALCFSSGPSTTHPQWQPRWTSESPNELRSLPVLGALQWLCLMLWVESILITMGPWWPPNVVHYHFPPCSPRSGRVGLSQHSELTPALAVPSARHTLPQVFLWLAAPCHSFHSPCVTFSENLSQTTLLSGLPHPSVFLCPITLFWCLHSMYDH